MSPWRVTSALVLLVIAAFGISFGVARLLRGDASGARPAPPTVVRVPHTRVAVFGPPARLPDLRSP